MATASLSRGDRAAMNSSCFARRHFTTVLMNLSTNCGISPDTPDVALHFRRMEGSLAALVFHSCVRLVPALTELTQRAPSQKVRTHCLLPKGRARVLPHSHGTRTDASFSFLASSRSQPSARCCGARGHSCTCGKCRLTRYTNRLRRWHLTELVAAPLIISAMPPSKVRATVLAVVW